MSFPPAFLVVLLSCCREPLSEELSWGSQVPLLKCAIPAILVALQNDTSTRHQARPGSIIAGWTAKWRNFRATPGLDCWWWDYDYTYPGITVKILICWAKNPIFHRVSPVKSHEIQWHVHEISWDSQTSHEIPCTSHQLQIWCKCPMDFQLRCPRTKWSCNSSWASSCRVFRSWISSWVQRCLGRWSWMVNGY